MNRHKKVSIIIVNYKDPSDTLELLRSLADVKYSKLEIILVDNGAEVNRTLLYRSIISSIKVYSLPTNLGFAGGVNFGIKKSTGEYILLLNNDTIVESNFLYPLMTALNENNSVGIVSPKILFYDTPNIIQYAGATSINTWFGRGKKFGFGQTDSKKFSQSGETGLCNGACMMIRRQVIEDVGLLSEDYFMYYEEHDFCFRAKRFGWKTYYASNSKIYHKQSQSIGLNSPIRLYYLSKNRLYFMRKFSGGTSLLFFYFYYLFFQFPYSIARHLIRGQFTSIKYVVLGLIWNLKN